MYRWFTVQLAAQIAAVSEKTIRRRLNEGELPGKRLDPDNPKSPWRIREDHLEAWINRGLWMVLIILWIALAVCQCADSARDAVRALGCPLT